MIDLYLEQTAIPMLHAARVKNQMHKKKFKMINYGIEVIKTVKSVYLFVFIS